MRTAALNPLPSTIFAKLQNERSTLDPKVARARANASLGLGGVRPGIANAWLGLLQRDRPEVDHVVALPIVLLVLGVVCALPRAVAFAVHDLWRGHGQVAFGHGPFYVAV